MVLTMKKPLFRIIANNWNQLFLKHSWLEAFILSIIFHVVCLCFLWFCCEIHVMMFPNRNIYKIIEIEFIK